MASFGGALYPMDSNHGELDRVTPAETIYSGLVFPTGMTIGPDGAFYVSEKGFGFGAGQGTCASRPDDSVATPGR